MTTQPGAGELGIVSFLSVIFVIVHVGPQFSEQLLRSELLQQLSLSIFEVVSEVRYKTLYAVNELLYH